jgi:hypothetical protein
MAQNRMKQQANQGHSKETGVSSIATLQAKFPQG